MDNLNPNIAGLDARMVLLLKRYILDAAHPVNEIYISFDHINPATKFGGTWVRLAGAFLYGATKDEKIGEEGGESEHILRPENLPSHSHSVSKLSGNTISSGGHTHQIGADFDGAGGGARYTVHSNGVSGAGKLITTSSSGAHTHSFTIDAFETEECGGGEAFSIMPINIKVSIWRRVS